eukprot:1648372-Pyramimonas_sp.AAC.1
MEAVREALEGQLAPGLSTGSRQTPGDPALGLLIVPRGLSGQRADGRAHTTENGLQVRRARGRRSLPDGQ